MKWIKPSGLEIETNDEAATVAKAESLGCKPVKKAPVKKAVKKKAK